MVLMFWQQVLMILTGGFDGFDVLTAGFDGFDRWFWWFWCFDSRFWQQVLMILTGGFDGFDVLTAGFDDFDRWFWWFWCFDSRFWQQVLMILTGGFCFWRLYNKWQQVLMVLMFWQVVFVFEGYILNHVIMTVGFVLWRRCYQEIPLPPIAAYLGLCCEKLWRLFTAVNKSWLFIK